MELAIGEVSDLVVKQRGGPAAVFSLWLSPQCVCCTPQSHVHGQIWSDAYPQSVAYHAISDSKHRQTLQAAGSFLDALDPSMDPECPPAFGTDDRITAEESMEDPLVAQA